MHYTYLLSTKSKHMNLEKQFKDYYNYDIENNVLITLTIAGCN